MPRVRKMKQRPCPQCKVDQLYEERATYCSKRCADAAQTGKAIHARKPLQASEYNPAQVANEARLRERISSLESQLNKAIKERISDEDVQSFIGQCLSYEPNVPQWVREPAKGSAKSAIATAILSDAHFGETVFPDQIEWLNGYDREIAQIRLQNFFHNTIKLARDYIKGVQYDGIILPMLGDMFSGDIHEELAQSNEGTMQEELLHWLDPMLAGLHLLAHEFGKVFVPVCVGNHPRGTRKPISKMRAPNNFDWLYAHFLRRLTASNPNIVWSIPRSADVTWSAYGTRFRATHGDRFRGGSGSAGLVSPLRIGDARMRKRAQRVHREYDWLLMGHWHSRQKFDRIMVNGSLKGFDEYSYTAGFDYSDPEQSFFLVDPAKGVTLEAPIEVLGKDEPWMRNHAQPAGLSA